MFTVGNIVNNANKKQTNKQIVQPQKLNEYNLLNEEINYNFTFYFLIIITKKNNAIINARTTYKTISQNRINVYAVRVIFSIPRSLNKKKIFFSF